jgi:hypothetical protein
MGGFPRTTKVYDYLFVVVVRFINMCILMSSKNTIKGQDATHMFFEKGWVYF